MVSSSKFNVRVIRFDLSDQPARISTTVEVAGQRFTSTIAYQSIRSWDALWSRHGLEDRAAEILGAIVAWDCMRFLALGGETVTLCAGLVLPSDVEPIWRHCFIRQFGEWRYRNAFEYREKGLPKCVNASAEVGSAEARSATPATPEVERRILLTNGGGKDSLVGMLLLSDAQIPYDIYEGMLPLGGAHEVQRDLLKELRLVATRGDQHLVTVEVFDDFYSCGAGVFERRGVRTHHFKSDFAIVHTANYIGYFRIILEHEYSGVWFNIEASADRTMTVWNGEDVNHQWCKSIEYQAISTMLFRRLTGQKFKDGFSSTLRGAYDTVIYAIAASEPEMLAKAHSCNLDKPWCRKCPKCCFSYLMLSSLLGENYAMRIMGSVTSLFEDPENRMNWRDLLDSKHVAWECVPSHRECLQAVDRCHQRGIRPRVFDEFADSAKHRRPQFLNVNWEAIPAPLRGPLLKRIGRTGMCMMTEVVIVGAGQAGLSMSRTLKSQNIAHLVLEAGCVGASWNSRWDSFQINTPNSTIALPGMSPVSSHGFMGHAEVQQLLGAYADENDLPVMTQVRVLSARQSEGGFILETTACEIEAKGLIVATGEYAAQKIPTPLRSLTERVALIHSSEYRNPAALTSGAVLVVGGGQSGAQIVEDLLESGRQVYWALSDRPSNIRRMRGKDFMEWWDIGGLLHNHISRDPAIRTGLPGALFRARTTEFPLVSGKGSDGLGHSISLQRMEERGVILLGKLERIEDHLATFRDVRPQCQRAIAGTWAEFDKLSAIADLYYEAHPEPRHEDEERFLPPEMTSGWTPRPSLPEIDLRGAGISTIVAATGFLAGWDWLRVEGILNHHGYPLGENGVAPVPGLFFMGMFNIQRLSSTCLRNGGRDSEALLPYVKRFLTNETLTQEPLS